MSVVRVEREIAGRVLSLETGKVAKQAHGAVWVRYGDTVVLATVLTGPAAEGIDFFPLYVDYRENQYAAGKVPGGFFKREGRPSTKEILTMRLVDRPIRPLFPDDFRNEVQIQCLVLSSDGQNDPDMLALIGASAALALSSCPFQGPIGAVRVGYVEGQHVINPTHSELASSEMELFAAGPREAVNMIEMGATEVPENVVAEGIRRGFEVCRQVIDMIDDLARQAGVPKQYEPKPVPADLKALVEQKVGDGIRQAKRIPGKVERNAAIDALREGLLAELCPEGVENPTCTPEQVKGVFYKLEGRIQRELILGGTRPDGRAMDQVRPLGIEVGVLPRTHGSAIFARGETQALVTATLGTPRDQQIIDGLLDEYKKPFMLHYNFPPFSVGEIRPIRGPGRREIGHGALAEKAVEAVMPRHEDFPYTVRVVADIMESNGSTSMATTCGATLALMDAGVPIRSPVAGISIGMVSDDGGRQVLLTDIVGEEDFHGDMDFKIAGTVKGITAIQLDMKARGIPQDRIEASLARAREARVYILGEMGKVISQPRTELSRYAPRMLTLHVDTEKIGKIIGPGGKTINKIQEETGATIDVEPDGTVYVACVDAAGADAARAAIEGLTAEVEVGKIYKGKVVSIRDFGAFVELFPGQDGMCHISELDDKYVKNVTDVCNVGDELTVKVISVDDQGRVRLSRKAVLRGDQGDDSSEEESPPQEGPPRGRHGHAKHGRRR